MIEVAAQSPLPREIALRFIPIIKQVAHRLARRLPAHISIEDLIGAGFIGLVEAHRRYDPARCDRFDGFAEFRIRGAMLDELRSHDPLSRDLRAFSSRAGATTRALQTQLGRTPIDAEIAGAMKLSLDAYRGYAAKAAVGHSVSLDAPGQDGEPALEVGDAAVVAADDQLNHLQSHEALAMAMAALPPRLRRVVELYYGDELTLRDIGGILGVTESRVCQLHAEAVSKLKAGCGSEPAGAVRPVRRASHKAAVPATAPRAAVGVKYDTVGGRRVPRTAAVA